MKKATVFLAFILLIGFVFSQTPIDYDNIDYLLLDTLIIVEVNKRRVVIGNPKINYSPTIRKGVSIHQTDILVREDKVYHPSTDSLYKKLFLEIKKECSEKYNKSIYCTTSATEVCIMIPAVIVKTYEELSVYMVDMWETSKPHKDILLNYAWSSDFVIGASSIQYGTYNSYPAFYGSVQIVSPALD
tara:strand:+ start:4219 stop:4779 length:561 start_codon:yes stop_codon:yes gene_type:complete